MKKMMIAAALTGGLMLGSCSTTGTITSASIQAEIIAILTPINKYVALACSAVPELASLIALANAGIAVGVTTLGGAFCSAFQNAVPTTPPAGARSPRYARRFGAGSGGLSYYCAGQICGWK